MCTLYRLLYNVVCCYMHSVVAHKSMQHVTYQHNCQYKYICETTQRDNLLIWIQCVNIATTHIMQCACWVHVHTSYTHTHVYTVRVCMTIVHIVCCMLMCVATTCCVMRLMYYYNTHDHWQCSGTSWCGHCVYNTLWGAMWRDMMQCIEWIVIDCCDCVHVELLNMLHINTLCGDTLRL